MTHERSDGPHPDALDGVVEDYNEQGMESDFWYAFTADSGSPRLFRLECGDRLKIMAPNGSVLFDGVIAVVDGEPRARPECPRSARN